VKLHSDPQSSLNTITGYGIGYIEVNSKVYPHALIVQPEGEISPWPVSAFADLSSDNLASLCVFKPELIIIGTGKKQQFLKPELIKPLIQAKIGFEMMDSQAACRTYNILMNEGRQVLAAIILDTSNLV
jgi:uncharacterized protein